MYEVLKTERLTLRPLCMSDTDDFAALVNEWDICRMTSSFPFPFPRVSVEGMLEIFMARAAIGRDYHWAITVDGTFIGVIGLHHRADVWSLGYWLGQPAWGHGYAGETIAAIIKHLDTSIRDYRLTAGVFVDNPASAHLLLKTGFQQLDETSDSYSLARRSCSPLLNFVLDRTQRSSATPSGDASMDLKATHEVS